MLLTRVNADRAAVSFKDFPTQRRGVKETVKVTDAVVVDILIDDGSAQHQRVIKAQSIRVTVEQRIENSGQNRVVDDAL
ncbi:hypothetical protein L7750_08750 [Xenorhabdus bovienii]|uniref:hypothetical protein n=1 Tax=Xenorhabdus bovienii TaxID=40576 RepID=UPI00056DCA37|nr:hypothetical protein [Xenorhabdus bovienii]MCG3470473.1 hypothetical protein [Xenorhabdus bovienii]